MNLTLTSLKLFLCLTIITGILYPILIFVTGFVIFPYSSEGRIIKIDEKKIGSELIGQNFKSDKYFKGRPSFKNYNPLESSGSNLSWTSASLKEEVAKRIKTTPLGSSDEMFFSSGSGLDPHISKKSAIAQLDRIINARNLKNDGIKDELLSLIDQHTERKTFNILGKERVNVFLLNLSLDETYGK